MKTNKKLYKVTLRGFTSFSSGMNYKTSYVVADDPQQAYQAVLNDLKTRDYGFPEDRELHNVELLAEDSKFTNVKTRLYQA
jgi:hypothetical protein